jgi:hypothetical protein
MLETGKKERKSSLHRAIRLIQRRRENEDLQIEEYIRIEIREPG